MFKIFKVQEIYTVYKKNFSCILQNSYFLPLCTLHFSSVLYFIDQLLIFLLVLALTASRRMFYQSLRTFNALKIIVHKN